MEEMQAADSQHRGTLDQSSKATDIINKGQRKNGSAKENSEKKNGIRLAYKKRIFFD